LKKINRFVGLKARLDKVFDVSSYGYVVNKWIFRCAFIFMLLLFLVVVRVDGWGVAVGGSSYILCDSPGGRLNPFGLDCKSERVGVDCQPEYLSYGEVVGFKPSRLARFFPSLCVWLFAVALLLNHYLYNKNWRFIK